MKKWSIVLLSLVTVYTGISFTFGMFAEKLTLSRLEKSIPDTFDATIDYKRGIYSSKIAVLLQSKTYQTESYNFDIHLTHGPILWSRFSLGAAAYDGKIILSQFKMPEPILIAGKITFSGEDQLSLSQVAQTFMYGSDEINLGAIQGTSSFRNDKSKTTLQIDSISVSSEGAGLRLGPSKVTVDGSIQELSQNLGIFLLEISNLEVFDEESRELLKLVGIQLETNASVDAHDALHGTAKVKLDTLNIAGVENTMVASFSSKFQYQGYEEVNQKLEELMGLESTDVTDTDYNAFMLKHAAHVLNPARIDIDGLQLKIKDETDDANAANLTASITFKLEDKDYSLDPLAILKGSRALFNVQVPKKLATTLAWDNWLQIIAMQGMAAVKDDNFHSKITLTDGDVVLNGQVLPLLK